MLIHLLKCIKIYLHSSEFTRSPKTYYSSVKFALIHYNQLKSIMALYQERNHGFHEINQVHNNH